MFCSYTLSWEPQTKVSHLKPIENLSVSIWPICRVHRKNSRMFCFMQEEIKIPKQTIFRNQHNLFPGHYRQLSEKIKLFSQALKGNRGNQFYYLTEPRTDCEDNNLWWSESRDRGVLHCVTHSSQAADSVTLRTNDTEHQDDDDRPEPAPFPGIICMIVVICGSLCDCDNCNPDWQCLAQWPGANEGRGDGLQHSVSPFTRGN